MINSLNGSSSNADPPAKIEGFMDKVSKRRNNYNFSIFLIPPGPGVITFVTTCHNSQGKMFSI